MHQKWKFFKEELNPLSPLMTGATYWSEQLLCLCRTDKGRKVKNRSNAINVTLHLYRQAIWGHSNSLWRKSVKMPSMRLCFYTGRKIEDTQTHSGEKHKNAKNVTLHQFKHTIWGESWKKRTSTTNCNFPSIQAGDLREHLKTPSGEKSFKCNHCDFPSVQAGDLRKHLKTLSGEKV